MSEALEQRVADLEALIGIDQLDTLGVSTTEDGALPINLEERVVSIRERLRELELSFILQAPVEKLRRLRQLYYSTAARSEAIVPLKDKLRAVQFSGDF